MLPTLFLSHGAPDIVISESPARSFLQGLGKAFEKPKAILVASAHWGTAEPSLNAVEENEIIYDFGGFPAPLYAMRYPAPGSQALAGRAAALIRQAGFPATLNTRRGLDHGAWVPLILAYPAADIPVVQLSVQPHLSPAHHLSIGRALEPLREEGILIIGSGGFTHNLYEFFRGSTDTEREPQWVSDFTEWFDRALMEGRVNDLVNYRQKAPSAERNHPTDEHLLPLYVAFGAAGEEARAQRLHSSRAGSALRLDAYAFTSA
ncbi:MAG: DODA-type extradiol aromatic ring-opening family dioxygenase [Rhodomicrobium sp.]